MAEFKKFDPYEALRTMGRAPNVAKAAKAAASLAALGGLGAPPRRALGEQSTEESVLDMWGEAEEERAAIVEHEGDLPRAWAEAFARLDCAALPIGFTLERWHRFLSDCGSFLDSGWAARAHQLGWSPKELFGCDRRRPFLDLAKSGLLWQVDGGRIILLSASAAIVASTDNTHRKYVRLPIRSGVVLAWRLVRNPQRWGGLKIGEQPHE